MINDELTKLIANAYLNLFIKEEKIHPDAMVAAIPQMARKVHEAWVSRDQSKPNDQQQPGLHVDYDKLPENEQAKDVAHVTSMMDLHDSNIRKAGESVDQHHDRLANIFGSAAHEDWRKGWQSKAGNQADTPRMKGVSDGSQVNINVAWKDLHPEWKADNLQAGLAASRIVMDQRKSIT